MQLYLENKYCVLRENRSTRKIEVLIGKVHHDVCMTHLRMLQRRLNAIDLESFFYNLDAEYDMFRLTLPNHKIVYQLRVVEAIALKEIINQMFFEFDLHTVLMRNNILPAANTLATL